MKRVLITGATGFVGANLTRRLLFEGHEVHLITRPNYQAWRVEEIREHVQIHEVNLADFAKASQLVAEIRPEWIFHLAAYGAYSQQTDLPQMIETNITGTASLVQACLKSGFEVFINTGSSSEYGRKNYPPLETDWLEPNSHYAITKASATHFCRYTAEAVKARIPTLRLYSVYGPYEEPTRLLPTLIRSGLQGSLPPLVHPDTSRDFVFIDDVCDAYLIAASSPTSEYGPIYNVGTGVQTTLRQVIEVAQRVLKLDVVPNWDSMEGRIWDTTTWVANPTKIKHELGWNPCFTFERGFRVMVDWYESLEGHSIELKQKYF